MKIFLKTFNKYLFLLNLKILKIALRIPDKKSNVVRISLINQVLFIYLFIYYHFLKEGNFAMSLKKTLELILMETPHSRELRLSGGLRPFQKAE